MLNVIVFLISIIRAGTILILLDHVLHILSHILNDFLGLVHCHGKPLLCCVHHLPRHVLGLVCHLSHPLLEPAEHGDEGADAAAGALGREAGLMVVDQPHQDGGTGKTANKESSPKVVRHFLESVIRLDYLKTE